MLKRCFAFSCIRPSVISEEWTSEILAKHRQQCMRMIKSNDDDMGVLKKARILRKKHCRLVEIELLYRASGYQNIEILNLITFL